MLTENEIISNSRLQVDTLVSALKRKKFSIEDVGDFIPGFVHLNDCKNHQITYLNKIGLEEWESSLEDIQQQGIDWMLNICQKDVLKQSFNKINDFNKVDDGYGTLSYYQFMRKPSNMEYEWYFTCKKKFDENNFPL